jgi:hypothetical protein
MVWKLAVLRSRSYLCFCFDWRVEGNNGAEEILGRSWHGILANALPIEYASDKHHTIWNLESPYCRHISTPGLNNSTPHQHRTPHHHTVASAFNTFHKFNTVALNGVYNPSPLSSNVSPP